MSFDCRHQATVAAPTDTLWRLLTDFSTWPTWWADCTAAQRTDRKPLAEGARVELVVRPAGRERTLRAIVDLLSEGRSLTLVSHSWVLRATVTWTLHPLPGDSARLRLSGAFSGLGSGRLGPGKEAIESSLKRQLRGLARAAERLI